MANPRDRQALELICRLKLLREEESEKASIRYREASGGQELVPFLFSGGYLGRTQIARLQAMNRSDGGDLYDDERETLRWICSQLPAEIPDDPEQTGVRRTDLQHSVRAKTLHNATPPQPPEDQGESRSQ